MNLLSPLKLMTSILFYLPIVLAICSCEKEVIEISGKTETFKIKSAIIQDDYEIFVFIPTNYNVDNNQNQLIVALDSDFHFQDISKMIHEKVQNGSLPPAIFVGVGNSQNRNRDYTPTAFKHGKGGAENFYRFLVNELIPDLELRYNLDERSAKTLMGNSFGGLFTHYAMFQNRASNPFNNFISVGASYWFDSGIIFEFEQKYNEANDELPVKFFNAMGILEGGISLGSFEEMNYRLQSRGYQNLEIESALIEKHGHSGSSKIGFKKGLDYVFGN